MMGCDAPPVPDGRPFLLLPGSNPGRALGISGERDMAPFVLRTFPPRAGEIDKCMADYSGGRLVCQLVSSS